MADGRKNNGGHSTKGKAGRKPKCEEQRLIEKLSPLESEAHKALKEAIKDNESWAVKLYFEYMYGKPKQSTELSGSIDSNVTNELTVEETKAIAQALIDKYI